jgi:hypothetical protein
VGGVEDEDCAEAGFRLARSAVVGVEAAARDSPVLAVVVVWSAAADFFGRPRLGMSVVILVEAIGSFTEDEKKIGIAFGNWILEVAFGARRVDIKFCGL